MYANVTGKLGANVLAVTLILFRWAYGNSHVDPKIGALWALFLRFQAIAGNLAALAGLNMLDKQQKLAGPNI